MSEERLTALEGRMYQLHADNARLSESVDHLADAVVKLTGVVDGLRDTMNRGKGALWLFGVMAATVGGLVSWGTTLLFRQA
jgi:predicted nuclease with TOPRIM domain